MTEMNDIYFASSRESEIDARLEALIAKIMAGTADDRERIDYQELLASRVRMSRPRRFSIPLGLRRKYA